MRNATKETTKKVYEIKEGTLTYQETDNHNVMFAGIKNGRLYVALNKEDGTADFISGYEALDVINKVFEQFESVDIHFEKATSKNGKDFEKATVVDLTLA